MELISPINDTWKYFAAGSIVGFSLLLLLAYQTHPNNINLEFIPLNEVDSTSNVIMPLEHFNFTIYDNYNNNVTDEHIQLHQEENNNNNNNNKTIINKCNMFDGKWVYKPDENPSYDSIKCPFIEEKMSCQFNGRPDFDYEKWTWEATHCDIPMFNGRDMLERLRNKRVILVGDSLNRNMWESLACLLYSSVSSSTVEVSAQNPVYKILKAKDYNCSVEFYWSPFLVEFVEKHQSGRKVLVLDKVSPNSLQWKGADVMVFNSGHWWLHGGKMKSWDLLEYEGKLIEEMPIAEAYEQAMITWTKWINKNVDPNKTKVVFRSLSAVHNNPSEEWCYNKTQPTPKESFISVPQKSDMVVTIIERVIKQMTNLHVKYLDITNLSQYRRDAHPSIYRKGQWKDLIKQAGFDVSTFADCSHWCLPGLPDTWNRLLYASLFFDF